jgi:Arc-like DNA binding domain
VPKAKKSEDRPIQILLRFPSGLRGWLSEKAKESGRSINAEVISRLEASKADNDAFQQLQEKVARLQKQVAKMEDIYNRVNWREAVQGDDPSLTKLKRKGQQDDG